MFISILEESGYMSRVVFLMDKIMRKFGLSGKSVVPLISGTACAIPAIMATRNIETERTTDNNFSNSFHDLFRSTACLRNYYCTCS
jgi:Fe2+ transport system protein B